MRLRESGVSSSLSFFLDVKALGHPVKRAAINAHDFSRARTIAADHFQHAQQVTAFEFVEGRQIVVERAQR